MKANTSKTKFLMLLLMTTLFNCKNNSKAIDDILLAEIDKYIEFCEKRAEEKSTFRETNIYIVYGSKGKGKDIIEIFQYLNYSQKNLDGYLNRGDNMIFFYDSNEKLVNTEQLNHELLKNLPDENSNEAQVGYNPIIWKYLLVDGKLDRINDSQE